MAENLETFTVPQLSAPEIAPRFRGYTPEDIRQFLNDALQDIGDEFNQIINIINNDVTNITIGAGGMNAWQVIAESEYGSDATALTSHPQLVAGAVCLVVTSDKQIVAGTWHLGKPLNTYTIQLLKAVSPYTVWTNLAGTSKAPTTIVYVGTAHNNGNPTIVQSSDGNLHVGYYDSTGGVACPKEAEFTWNGAGGWTIGTTQSLVTTHTFVAKNEGEIIEAADGKLLWARVDTRTGPNNAVHIYRRIGSSWGTDPIATYTAYYDAIAVGCAALGTAVGEDCRLLQLDASRVVAFWPWQGNTTDGLYTLLYTMSVDGGATWPQSACAATSYAIGYPGTATGSIFPLAGGAPPVPSANMQISGGGGPAVQERFWDVARIPGTNRAAIVIWGEDGAADIHGELPGIRYLEFDPDGNGGLGSVTALADWVYVNHHVPISSLMLSVSDGVTRVLWGQGVGGLLNDGAISLMTARVVDGGSPLVQTDWTNPKEVMRFSNEAASQSLQYFQFTAPVSGVFTMENEEKVWPVLCARYPMTVTTRGSASTQALLALLRVAELDRA